MAESIAMKSTSNRPNDLHTAVYRAWGEGQYGMLVTGISVIFDPNPQQTQTTNSPYAGNVQVDPRYFGESGDLAFNITDLTNPVALSQWKTWATVCQASGTPTVVQLCHTGRQSPMGAGYRSLLAKTIAPSAVALDFPGGWVTKLLQWVVFGTPREMTLEEIDEVVGMFVGAARMSWLAGFKGVELHAAHGYLLTQFLSPKVGAG